MLIIPSLLTSTQSVTFEMCEGGRGDGGKEKKGNVTAGKDTSGHNKVKEKLGVENNISEGKIIYKNDTNPYVTATVSDFVGINVPAGRSLGNQIRRHLPPVLGTMGGVGGQAVGRDEVNLSRVGVEQLTPNQ